MSLRFVLAEAWNGLRRNVSMVVSVVLVTLVSLTFVGSAVLLQLQVSQMKSFWYDKAQVAVYLCTEYSTSGTCNQQEASEDQKAAIQAQLDSATLQPYVDTYYFENHEQAYDNFVTQFEGSAVVDLVTADLLPETYWVSLVDPTQSAIIFEAVGGMSGVESVVDQRSYLDGIFSMLNAASLTAVGVAALMLVAAALLIATTIRLSAFSRRRELAIMRLVGASNWFIQTPFIVEGVVAATIGSLLACAVVVGIVVFFVDGFLADAMPTTSFIQLADAGIVFPILLGVGAILAATSAYVAISRYLRV
ncbi:cell division transport system permease protein [Microbacteriaceae bacterium MWH-Ta3]|nr:cell division transport system permease protein [Microbacteriaceae bacterium MWH-Ta3]